MGAAELLGPAGPFADVMPGYEPRPGQLGMASAIERCLAREGVAVIEAGTGTGKTLAYLVPALLASAHKKIVISTATRALQDQIFQKDLPLVLRTLGFELPVALMKGLGNYVCKRRYQEFLSSGDSLRPEWQRSLPLVDAWLAASSSGATDDLAALGEDDPIWPRISASSERRVGPGCRYFDACYVTAMKREAARARIVVVNHHLFFADLALRGAHPASVIPDYDAVIFDEAHLLEEIATEHFGVSVSSARLARLASDAAASIERAGGAVADSARRIEQLGEGFFDELARAVRATEGRAPVPLEVWAGAVESRWFELDTALEALGARINNLANERERGEPEDVIDEAMLALSRRSLSLRDDLASIAQGGAGSVVWFESSARARKLSASPVNLAPVFQSRLFDVVPSVVLTSATLSSGRSGTPKAAPPAELGPDGEADEAEPTTERPAPEVTGPFRFLRKRLGLDAELYPIEELSVPSPFDFEAQALLYLPNDLPQPDHPGFVTHAAERIAQLVAGCDGGAFVLTTSLRSMLALHRALEGCVGNRLLLLQGQVPKAALLERFRQDQGAVLIATQGFWQGVDVPGAALRLVVLEKVPFPVPSDPILRARAISIEEAGGSPFGELHLPLAELTLKQGFGRLIRTRSDYGVVALLDCRVHQRGYGRALLRGLPAARRVTELGEVERFWAARRAHALACAEGQGQ